MPSCCVLNFVLALDDTHFMVVNPSAGNEHGALYYSQAHKDMKEKRRFIFELRIKAPLKKGNIQVKQN
jgi:hypothetical protein